MRRVLVLRAIAGRFLRRQLRDRSSMAQLFVVPLILAAVFGFADQYAGSRLPIGVVLTEGSGPLAEQLAASLGVSETLAVERFDSVRALEEAARIGDVVVGVEIPADYSTRLAQGSSGSVRVFGVADSRASRAAQGDASLAVSTYETVAGAARVNGWIDPRLVSVELASRPEVAVERATARGGSNAGGFGRFTAGMLIFFLFEAALNHGATLRDDRRCGTFARMTASANPTWVIVGGEMAGRALLGIVQAVIVVAFGAVAFGIQWGDPLGVAVIVVLFVLAALGAGLLVGVSGRPMTFAETEMRTVGLLAAAGLLGGCFWALSLGPRWLEVVAHVTPHAWANDALGRLLATDAGIGDVLAAVVALAGFTAALFALAVLRLRRPARI